MDISPDKNGLYPFSGKSKDQILKEFSFKKVKLTGVWDHNQELRITKKKDGLNGFEIITPFITHLNKQGEKCGLMVNRGWIVEDLIARNLHYRTEPKETITGYIYGGDHRQKYDIENANSPINSLWSRAWPDNMAVTC